ncbi:hypothetical protein [Actinomadura alba]|uniref:Integral membrane protein n=1 Tax=Actinomadura alba TaxID=406431 RepID=A0ABR7LJJ3_9ACTN|nr:hypothetical protein [Actinomadura alba]MBC6464963.1 hypothetical protein [Actinomadura alba]
MTSPPIAAHARTPVRVGWAAADQVVPRPRSEAGEAGRVVFIVLLGSWIVAVTASGVLIPPVPLLVFLLFQVSARRRRASRGPEPAVARGPARQAERPVSVGH